MAVKRGATKSGAKTGRAAASVGVPVRNDLSSIEEETIARAGNTLAAISEFLFRWENSVKPKAMSPQVERISRFYNELLHWMAEAKGGRKDDRTRERRLRELVVICRNYS